MDNKALNPAERGNRSDPVGADTKEQVFGAGLAITTMVIGVLLALVTTPILVHGLGLEGFGRYSLAISVLAVFILFDGGLTNALIRFALPYRAEGTQALFHFLRGTLPIYLVLLMGLVTTAVCVAVLVLALGGDASSLSIYALAVVGAVATLLANPFRAIMAVYERFVAARLMEMLAAIAAAALSIAAVVMGFGAEGAMAGVVASAFGLLAGRAAYVGIVLRVPLIGAERFKANLAPQSGDEIPRRQRDPSNNTERRAIIAYALPILATLTVDAAYARVALFLIAAVLGPSAVALYAVALLFQKHILRLSTAITKVMVPTTLANVDRGVTGSALLHSLCDVARVQVLLLGPAVIALAAFGDTFLALWLGPEFAAIHPIMVMIMAAYACDQVGSLRHVVLQARGLYWLRARQAMVIAFVSLSISLLLMPSLGLMGAALAYTGGLLCSLLAANHILSRRAGVQVKEFYLILARAAAPALAGACGVGLAVGAAIPANWWGLFLGTGVYGVATLTLIWKLGLTKQERHTLVSLVIQALPRRWRVPSPQHL
ncbi:MAG: oligosaccharide flippase family protein [Pseudomonadota bacterium]